jgi:hypothetical protein
MEKKDPESKCIGKQPLIQTKPLIGALTHYQGLPTPNHGKGKTLHITESPLGGSLESLIMN